MKRIVALTAAIVLSSMSLTAADTFPDVEYVAGKSGFNEKIKGSLVIDANEIRFSQKGGPVFSIPIEQVVQATQSREREEGSFGRKMALGIFASKNQEYLRIETRSAEAAEVIVFKTKKEKSPGLAAKINFARDAAKAQAAAAELSTPQP